MRITKDISNSLSGFGKILLFPFRKNRSEFLFPGISIFSMIIICGFIGVIRNFLEVWIGGSWANLWFSLSPDIFFTMFFYPVFLTFFPAVILYYISRLFRLRTEINKLLSIFFYLQVFQVIIPFFDMIADLFKIPHSYLFSSDTYIKLIFSPVALTPVIILFTRPTSLGIDIAWFFTAAVMLKYFLKVCEYPLFKALFTLGITFYIVYMSIYPNYTFFLNERIRGDNFHFGLFFMIFSLMSIFAYLKINSLKSTFKGAT